MALILPDKNFTKKRRGDLILPGQVRDLPRELPESERVFLGGNIFGTQTTTPAFQFKPKRDTFFGVSPEGIELRDVVRELPTGAKKTFRAIGRFGKAVGQAISRSAVSLGGTDLFSPTVDFLSDKIVEKGRESVLADAFTEDFARRMFGDIEDEQKGLLGETPKEELEPPKIRTKKIGVKVKRKGLELIELSKTEGLSARERIIAETLGSILSEESEGLAKFAVFGLIGIDLSPFGGTQKGAWIAMRNAKTLGDAMSVLQKMRIADDLVIQFAPDVVKVADEKGAKALFDSISNLQRTTRVAVPPTAKRLLGIEPAPFVKPKRTREDTALRAKLKAEQVVARRGALAGERVGVAATRAIEARKTAEKLRRQEISFLRKGITVRLKTLATGLRDGSIAKMKDILKAGDELKVALKKADVPSEDAKWFTNTFKNLKGVDDLAKKMPTILARMERLENAREIRTLKSNILNEIKITKPKIGQKKVLEGKFGAEAQKQLNFLRGTTKESIELTGRTTKKGNVVSGLRGSRTKALAKINENTDKYGVAVDGVMPEVPPEIARQNALLNMVGIQNMSVVELRATLENLRILKTEGQLNLLRIQSNKAAELELIKDTAKVEFKSKRAKAPVLGEVGREMNPVVMAGEILENAILSTEIVIEKFTFSKEFKVAEWVGNIIRTARNGHSRLSAKWSNEKVRGFKKIFGEEKIGRIYREMNIEKQVWKGKDALGNVVEMKLTQFEAAYWWGLARDPTNIPLFQRNMNFTPEMFKALDSFLDPRMKKYTNFLMDDWLKEIRVPVNERYKVKFGMDMPDNPNYLPRAYSDQNPEEITNLLFGDAFPSHPSTVPSGVKARVGSAAQFRKISIEQMMRRHLEQMNQFVHFDEVISDMRRVFTDTEVRDVILKNSGKPIYNTLTKKIDDIARGGAATQMKLAGIDWLIGNFTKSTLMLNWVPFLKQLTSFPAFTLGRKGLSYTELMSGAYAYYQHPVRWTKFFAESDFIFGRLTKGFNREVGLAFRRGDADFTIKEIEMSLGEFLKKGAITPTRGGDMVPILPGLTAKYLQVTKQLSGKGLSKQEIHKKALEAAEDLAARTQQSPHIENLGRIQTANSIGKAISMYSTTPIQYLRETTSVIRMWSREQINAKDMIRTVITSWIVLPQLFQFVSNGFNWNNERQLRALLLGPINYYPAAGNLMGTMYDALSKGETWKGVASAISPLFAVPENIQQSLATLHKILTKDGDMEDWVEFAEKLYRVIGLTTGKLPTSGPIRNIEGLIDLTQGDTKDPRRLIFSEYALQSGNETGDTVERERVRVRERERQPRRERARVRER